MSWTAIAALAGGAYLFKVAGVVVFNEERTPPWALRVGSLLPAALLAALVVVGCFEAAGGGITVDARGAGVAAAAVAVWRRAPFVAVVVIGAVVTALVRALSG